MARQRTVALIKPDAYDRAELIIKIIEKYGFDIVTQKTFRPSRQLAEALYGELKEEPFFNDHITHMTSGPIVALVLEKSDGIDDAVEAWRGLVGDFDPVEAEDDTLRKTFTKRDEPIFKNAVHGSDSPESAAREIALLFPKLKA